MRDAIIIRTNEICLKGGNRGMFEKRLVDDVRDRLARVGGFAVQRHQGNVIAVHDGALSDAQIEECRAALRTAFGIAWIVFASRVPKDIDAVAGAAEEAIRAKAPTTFKVFASRSDKSFPMDSQEIAREIGGRLLEAVPGLSVDVHEPATRVMIEIGKECAYVSADREEGAGGLPGGVAGKVVAMLSGGIDSPVAAWKLMRRGCAPVFVHFHSYPYVGRASIDKVARLAARLDAYAGGSTLHLVPIGDAQREITVKADESCRILLYRRLMLRVAERIARREGALGIVTGDSVGQVASQTLENIAAVSAVAGMPIYRPLVGDDKEDIVRAARRIGTYPISIEPHDDCCSLFVPQHPATRADAAKLDAEERKYDLAALVEAALAKTEAVAVGAADKAPVLYS